METILIETSWNKQNFIRFGKIIWHLSYYRILRTVIYYFISAAILLIVGFIIEKDENALNPLIIIGSVIFMTSLFSILVILFTNLQYSTKVKKLANKYDDLKLDNKIEVDENVFKYWDKEKYFELKWQAFSSYSQYKNYLILSTQSIFNSIIIEKTDLDAVQFENILELVKRKLKRKI